MATLYDDISLGYHACGGSKVGKLYSFKPTDGSGDFDVTRAGTTAFTQTPDSYWKPAAANEPRFTYTGGVRGLLVENAATRLNADPYSIEKASWYKSGAMVEGDPATAGSELFVTPSLEADWTNNGNDTYSCNGAGIGTRMTKNIGSVMGDIHLVTVNCSSYTSGSCLIHISGSISGQLSSITVNSATSQTKQLLVNSTTAAEIIYITSSSFIGTISISVKKLSGFDCPFVDANGINTKQGRKLVATANNGSVKLATPVTVTAATSYVNSVYIKRLVGTGTIYLVDVNNTDRAVTVTSEWTRVQYAAAAAGTTGQLGIKMATAGDEVMVCYMPIEAGTVATSPIGGAEGATQTRNADVVAKTGVSALIGQTEGTFIIRFNVNNLTNDVTYIDIQGIDTANRIFIRKNTNILSGQCQVTAGVQAGITKIITAGEYIAAFAYKENDFAFAVNGELVGIDTVGVLPAMTKIGIGGRADGASYINSTINYAVISKTRLPNATLQALTTL